MILTLVLVLTKSMGIVGAGVAVLISQVVLAIGVLPGLIKVLRADRVARPAPEAVQPAGVYRGSSPSANTAAKAQAPVEVREDAA
jgi:hypothetical protein